MEKINEANSIGGLGPVATFQGPLVNPKLGLLPPQPTRDAQPQLPAVIPELDTADETPLHTPRSANSDSSMKSALSTMHPTSLSGGRSMVSRRTTAGGEPAAEFEDVFGADDLELGGSRNDREDVSLLRADASLHSTAYDSSGNALDHREGNYTDRSGSDSTWSGMLQNPTVLRLSQATRSLGSKLKGKYAEYRENRL